ncbi:MAG: hypothetical protein WDN06_09235 [Asticcacaulis sp.]
MISTELEFRYVKEAIFSPFMALFEPRGDGLAGVRFDAWILDNLWAALEISEPELHKSSRYALRGLRTEDPTPVVFFCLVTAGAKICREKPEKILPAGAGLRDAEAVAEFANYLDLHRILRAVLHRLPEFMGRIDAGKGRFAAADVQGRLRHQQRRRLSLHRKPVRQSRRRRAGGKVRRHGFRPAERPLPGAIGTGRFRRAYPGHDRAQLKELKAVIGRRGGGCDDLGAVGDRITQSLGQLQSFEHYIDLQRDGPWGKRVAEAHRIVAEMVEGPAEGRRAHRRGRPADEIRARIRPH